MGHPKISAAIICSPGKGDGYLPGTLKDVRNWNNYLSSPKSGNLRPDEITTLIDPAAREALALINNTAADYQIVYFSGHGAMQNGRQLLAFKDGNVPDTSFLNNNPRQLIIVDACRSHLPAISGIPEAEDLYSEFGGGSEARRVFEQFIISSPPGKLIVHATHAGAVSSDIAHLGGAFTYNLLRTAIDVNTSQEYSGVFIEQLLPLVKMQMDNEGYEQCPEVTHMEGDLRVPFIIDAPQIEKWRNMVMIPVQEEQTMSPVAALACVVAFVGLIHLFSE